MADDADVLVGRCRGLLADSTRLDARTFMPGRIEDYAMIGDCHSGALVSRHGSLDWLCLPRFDSPACFAALLGTSDQGHWSLRPRGPILQTRRQYRDDTLILETDHQTETGQVKVIDWMPIGTATPMVMRTVVGVSGQVPMEMELVVRFDYGSTIPWVRQQADAVTAVAGPDAVCVWSDIPLRGENLRTVGDFTVRSGERVSTVLAWHPSYLPRPEPVDAEQTLADTESFWLDWASKCNYDGPRREAVIRSLITLKSLTYQPTGGMIAALTTSLPEEIGGVRNWDYRYCWVRDATLTLYALLESGYEQEARSWRDWLVRAVAGHPGQVQSLYGIDGARRLNEWTLDWLSGYEHSAPVRVGNAAAEQLQLDTFGELMDTLHTARLKGLPPDENAWRVQQKLLAHLEQVWRDPDQGIWELRDRGRQLTHSKVMVWVAFDRAVQAVERFHLPGDAQRWRALRDEVHEQVCREGYHAQRGVFVQSYGSEQLDAALLLMPLVGFLPADDPRIERTIAAIRQELAVDGLVRRYQTELAADGLPGDEGAFLLCSFWLADALALSGKRDEAEAMFEHLLSLRNDVGLLAEEYDPRSERMLGNFPQAFSHIALINTARNIHLAEGPSKSRSQRGN